MYIFKKNKRRIMAWCLIFSMILTLLPSMVFAGGGSTSWDGTVDTSWYNTSDKTFEIDTAAELAGLAAIVNGTATGITQDSFEGKTVTLTADLDLGGVNNSGTWSGANWVPIGGDLAFKGTFDGTGKKISNLYCSRSGKNNTGFFGYINYSGKVKNLNIISGYITAASSIGAIIGTSYGTVLNCSSNVEIVASNSSTWSEASVGGLAGKNFGYIINSFNNGNISSNNRNNGGIAGYNGGTVKDCYNTGNIIITTTTVKDINAGTIVGRSYTGTTAGRPYSGVIENVYSTGSITGVTSDKTYYGVICGKSDANPPKTNGAYYLKTDSINNGFYGVGGSAAVTSDAVGTASKNTDELKNLASTLGDAFESDSGNINNGYPVLSWQNTGVYEDEMDGLDISGISESNSEDVAFGFSVTMNKLLEYSSDLLIKGDFQVTALVDGKEVELNNLSVTASSGEAATTVKISFDALKMESNIQYKIRYKQGQEFTSTTVKSTSDYWLYYPASDFEGGKGTAEEPYQISSPEQLAYMARYSAANNQFAGKYIVLTKDIDLNGKKWIPTAFSGFFDGQGHSIKNMTTEGTSTGDSGLFSQVTPGSGYVTAYLANIHIIEPQVSYKGTGTAYLGALAGEATDTNVVNCSVEGGKIDGSTSGYSGGLIGSIKCSKTIGSMNIKSCFSTAQISGSYAGGLIGYANYGNTLYGTVYINDCYSGGSIAAKLSAGGIIGTVRQIKGLEINHCFSTAGISVNDGAGEGAGGLIGKVVYGSGQVIGPDGVTITNSAVLNPTISTSSTSTKAERLVGNGADLKSFGRLSTSNNYGWELTSINGVMVTGSELYGTNFTLDTAYTKDFWENTLGFDFSDNGRWSWTGENYYPRLKADVVAGVFELSLTAQPEDAAAYDNKAAAFAVAVSGGSMKYTYQWQYKIDNEDWSNIVNGTGITGVSSSVLKLETGVSYSNGTLVRCVISDNAGHTITSESAVFTKNSGNYTVENAKNKLFSYYQNKGTLTQPREAFSLLESIEDLSGFTTNLPYYYKYSDKSVPSGGDKTGYFYWLLMDCYALGVDPHDYVATGKGASENLDVVAALLKLQNEETGSFKDVYHYDANGSGLPAIILSLEMYFNGKNWGNESSGKSLGRDAAIQYFFSQIKDYDVGGKIYGTIPTSGEYYQTINGLRAQAEAVILLARLSDDPTYGAQAKEAMTDILTALNVLYNADSISYTENMALYVSALVAAAEADSAKADEYSALAKTIITDKLLISEAFDGSYGQMVGTQEYSGDADATAAVMMALGDYCNGKSLLADYVYVISDKNAVQNDLNAISIPENVTEDITLPAEGEFGSAITWTTSNAQSITSDGKVTKSSQDVVVALTATAVKGSETATKKFLVVIKADIDADAYAVNTALSKASVIFEAIRDITIPDSTVDGVSFSWTSSNPEVLTTDGKVTRPALGQPDKEVTFTLTATKGNATETKEFKVMVYSYKDTSTTKGQIEEGYYMSRDYYLYNRTLSGYWNVFAAYSALGDYIQDPDNGYVYDITGNSDEQSGAHILALVALGENPYNYKGNDLVKALLQKGLLGSWSVPVFNALGLEAAGSNGDLSPAIQYSIGQMRVLDMGPDIPGWAAVVLSRHLNDGRYDKDIKSEVSTFAQTLADNLAGNSMGSNGLSYGCVITGFNALLAAGESGYDITKAPWSSQNPIQVMYDNLTNGEHGVDPAYNVQYRMEFADLYNTLYNDGNVGWLTCGVSKDKLETQKAKAQEILNNNYKYEADSITAVNDALALVNTISEDRLNAKVADYGEEYYTLYDAVRYVQLSGEDSDTDIAKQVADYINALPSVENLKLSDEESLTMARNAYEALTNRQQGMVGSDALAKLEALEAQMVVLKRLGIEISGDWVDTPGYDFTLKVDAITQSDERYSTVQKKIQEDLAKVTAGQSVSGIDNTIAQILKVGNLLALYDLKLYDGTDLVEEIGNHLQFSIPVPGGYDSYLIVHLKADGTMEYIVPQVKDGKLVFSLSTLSPVGVIGYNSADVQTALQASATSTITGAAASTGDDSLAGMYAFLLAAAFLAMAGGYGVRRKNKLHSDTK